MGHTMFFIIALVATAYAGPIQEVVVADKCARQCTVSSQFNYEAGKTYEFTYETELRTAIQGASEEHAGVHLTATVHMDFLSKCEMVMRLSDVKLSEHDPETSTMTPVTSDLILDLQSNPLAVSFQDGRIEELCLSKPENEKILNIKRGILSLIQNNMDDITKDQTVTEMDVSGECDTEYSSSDKGWYNRLIKKSKNLLGCKGRQSSNTAIQSIPYTSDSDFQSLPLIKSTHECEQEVTKTTGRLQSATCREQHSFAPFSRQGSGAITHSTQTLTFVKEQKSRSKPEMISMRAPLSFQQTDGNSDTTRKDMERKLMEICDSTMNGVTEETPNLFSSLVYTMKSMSANDMLSVLQKIQNKEICPSNNERVSKFFFDAIPMSGTVDSLRLMVQLLTSGQISGIEADMWMTTLSFIQKPTLEMIAEVKALLSMKTNLEKAMLSVSSLVHSVCKNNPNCDNYLDVKKIISLLEGNIAPSCKISDETFQTSLIALRAIGNAGFGTGAIPTLVKCIQRIENPIEIRLSAVEAFRRIPCKADKSSILSIFTNVEEDSEIRIAAYKSLMACPSDELLNTIKVTLGKEEVNQVGSYVWSHLTNLMETADPHKQTIRSIIEDETLLKEFDMDKRKFSRNYEKSLFLEKLNTGATAEGDLIWSSKSFIPRSAMVNLTVDLFGNAINLFEVGGRIEGLEYFIESYFGPNGYFSDKDVKETFEETAIDVVKADKVNRITKRNTRVMDDLRGSLYMRVFGNELRYMHFQGLDSLVSKNNFNFLDMLMNMNKDNDYQYTHSTVFLDSTFSIPTSSGFPISLTCNGTATVDMKASGKMDVLKLTSSPATLDINGIIRPSAAIVVSSIMGIDALDTKVGIKMVQTLHSRTSLQGKISIAEGSILNVEFDLPEEKQEIISVSSSFFTVHRHSEREQKMITDNRQDYSACSGSKLAKITGLELCAELSFPNASMIENAPYFPLTGPIRAGFTLYKRDNKMTGYILQARSTHTADENIIRFAFSTPNSNVDRSFGIDLSLNKAQGAMDASFTSPWKRADFKGTFVNDRSNKGISGRLNWDGSVRFDVTANLQSESSGQGMIYTPTIKIVVPGLDPVGLAGFVKYAPWKVFETDMSLTGLRSSPITVKSSIESKAKMMSASASLSLSPKQVYSVVSSMQTTEYKQKIVYKPQITVTSQQKELFAFGGSYTNVFGKNIELDIVLDKIVETPILLKTNLITKSYKRGRMQNTIRVDLRSYLADIKMRNKFDNRNGKTLAADIDLTYVIRQFARDNIKLVTKLINLSSKSLTKARASLNLASKRYTDYNMKLIGNVNHNNRHSELEADIAYGTDFKDANKQISLSMAVDRAFKSWSEAQASVNGKLLVGTDFKIITKLDHSHQPKSLDCNVNLRLNKDAFESSLSLKDKSAQLKDYFGQFKLDIPGKSVDVSQSLTENSPNVFINTMNARFGKYKNTVVASWSKPSDYSLKVSSDINIYSLDQIVIDGEYDFGQDMYKVAGSVQKASDKYSAVATAQIDVGKTIQISTELSSPNRRVISNLEGTKSGNRYTSRADIRWNADRDDTQRITFNGNGQMTDFSNVEGSMTIQYPNRTIGVNIKNSMGSKYATHIDVQWEPTKVISFDSTFGDYSKINSREIIGSVKISSPYQALQSLSISTNHQINADQYQTKLDSEWNLQQTISGTVTVKKPISFKNIDVNLIAKAPSLGYKNIEAQMQHKIDNGVSSTGKLIMNKQTIQYDLSLTNKSDEMTTDYIGQIDIKTSFRSLRTATITLSHNANGKKIDTKALGVFNQKQLGFQSSLTREIDGWNFNTVGEITFSLPSDTIKTTWDHKNTLSEMTSKSEITWDNKRIVVNFNGMQDIQLPIGTLSAALQIQTPFYMLKDVVFQLKHLYKTGTLDSTLNISSNGNKVATIEGKFFSKNGRVTSRFTASNPMYDGTVSASLNADLSASPMTGHLELSLTPIQTVTIDGSYDRKSNGNTATSLTVVLPNKPSIIISGSRTIQQAAVNMVGSIQYDQGKIIRMESVYQTGPLKQMKLKFNSPFTNDYSADATLDISKNNFIAASGSIEAEPYVSRWSFSSAFTSGDRISGNIKISTPYREVPYSQISILSEIVEGSRQTSIDVEYKPSQIVKLSSTSVFNSINDLQLNAQLMTPFERIMYSSLTLRHRGSISDFSNYVAVEYPRGQTMSAESKFSSNSGIQGSFRILSPYTEEISASISHSGDISRFACHGEVTWEKTVSFDLTHEGTLKKFSSAAQVKIVDFTYGGTIKYSLDPKMTTEISFTTPITNFEKVHLSHSFEGRPTQFSTHVEVSTSGFGTFSSDISADMESKIDFRMTVQTPVKAFKDMKAAFTHEGSLARFSTHAEFMNGVSTFSGDIKLNTNPAFNLEATVNTPYKSIRIARLSVTFDGHLENFKLHAETQLNKDTSEIDLISNTQKKWNIDFTIRSPYITDTVKGSFAHWGNWKKFQSELFVQSGKDKLISNIKFALNPTFNAVFTIKSPFDMLKNQELQLEHTGSLNSFKCNMQYKNNGKTYVGDATFQNLNALKAEMNLKGPTFRPINIAVSYDGQLANFKSSAAVSLGKNTIQLDGNFNSLNGVKGSIGLVTPFEGYQSLGAAVSHSGDLRNFKTHGELTFNRQTGKFDIMADTTKDLSASLQITPPFKGYDDISASLKHTGGLDNFNTMAQYAMNGKSIEGQVSYQSSPLAGSASLKSTYPGIDNYDASFRHEGSLRQFSTNAELNIANKRSTADLSFDSTNGYEGKLSVNSPFLTKTDIQMKHISTDNSMTSTAFLAQNDAKQYSIQSDISMSPLSGIISIQTPHDGFESTELSLHHDGSIDSFRSDLGLELFGEKYDATVSFRGLPDMQCSLTIRSPLSKNIEATVSYQGKPSKFNSQFDIFYGKINKLRLETTLNLEGPYSGDIQIISPVMKNFKASFSHTGGYNDFSSEAQVIYAGQKTEGSLIVKVQPDFETAIKIASPLTKDININFGHYGPLTNCRTTCVVSYGGQPQFTANGQFNYLSFVNGEFQISSTIPGLRQLSTKFSHDGDLSGFKCHGEVNLEDQSASADIKYSPSEGSITLFSKFGKIDGAYTMKPNSGSIRLSTPFTNDLRGSYRVKDNVINSESNAELSYGSKKLISVSGNMNYPRFGDITIQTPVAGLQNTRLTWTRTGYLGGNAAISIGGVKHEGSIVINAGSKVSARAYVDSPMLPKASANLEFSGKPDDFLAHADITYENEKHSIDAMHSMKDDVKGSLTIASPLISDTSVTFNTNKDLNNLDSSAAISYGPDKIFEIRSTTENSDRKSGTITITLPDNTLTIASSFDGRLTDFTAHIEAAVNEKKIESDVTFSLTPLRADVQLKSPYKDMRVTFAVDGTVHNFNTKSSLQIDNENIGAEIVFNIETAIEGRATVDLPSSISSSPVTAAFNFNGISTNFRGHCEISVNNMKSEGDISFVRSPMKAKLSIKSPVKNVGMNFAFDGSIRNFKTQMGVSIDKKEMNADITFDTETTVKGSAKISIPGMKPYEASFEHSRPEGNMRSIFSVEQDENALVSSEFTFSKSPLKAAISVKTPIDGYKTMSALFSHDGKITTFNNHAEVTIEDQKSQCDMSFNFGSKLEGRISANSPYFSPISTGFEFAGYSDRFSSSSDFSYGIDKYSIISSIDITSGIDVSASVITPFSGYRNVTAKLTHIGQSSSIESSVQVKTGRRNLFSGSAKVDNMNGINAKFSIQSAFTPTIQFNLEHVGSISNFNTNAEVRYDGQPTKANVGFKTSPSISGRFSASSPVTSPVSGSFDVNAVNDKVTIHAEGNLDSKSVAGDASFEYGDTIDATVSLTTPFAGYENMRGSFKYIKSYKGFASTVNAEYSGIKLGAEARASWRDTLTGSITVSTPFEMIKYCTGDFSIAGTFPNVKAASTIVYNGEKYAVTGEIQKMNGKLTITTPLVGFEDLEVMFKTEGTIENMNTNARITYMTGKDITASFQNKITSERLETKASLTTPYTEDISFDLTINGKPTDFSKVAAVTMGENSAILTTTFKLGSASLEFDSALQTNIIGNTDEQKLAFLYQGILPNIKSSASAKILGSFFSSEASLTVDNTITGMFALRTPIQTFKDIALNVEHTGDLRRFSTKADLQYDTNRKIVGSLEYVKYGWRRLQTTVEVRTPFSGFEISKASYRHTASVDSLECDADLSFMNKDFSGELRSSMSPLSVSVSASTPYLGFEQVSADAKLAYGSGFLNAQSSVQYMQGKVISLSSDIDFNSSPKSARLILTTPFSGYEKSEMSMTHSGDKFNLQSTASLTSSFLPSMRSQASLKFSTVKAFDGSIFFESEIPNLENLRLTVKNEGIRGKYNSKLEASWAPSKTIALEGIFTDNRNTMTSEVTLKTPFDAVRKIYSKTETEIRGTLYTHKSTTQYNGKVISDLEISINLGDKKVASVLVRAPVEGLINLEGSLASKYEGMLAMSKDITDISKGLTVSGTFDSATNELSLKYKCPEKTLSFDGIHNNMNSKADLYVDTARYGYDMSMVGNNGKVKVILPSRSLVFSVSQQSGTTVATYMWDADKDETKQIVVRSVLNPTKADITVMMPSFGKEVQIDSQMSLNRGRIIFDGKTELTYSRDSRKKFTIMSRLEDISNDWSSKNYSFTFGISHPYTSLDVQVSSQFGKSDQKLTGGIDMKYLTVTRETKAFSVNGQIDKARKAFSLNMNTPMKKIGIDGNALTDSPYRLALTNKYDDKRPLNTILSFDTSKRSVDFQMNYDLDNPNSEFHLSAKYVNSSAIAAEIFHVVNRQRVTDVLMALRLNSSNLLHSRLHWRPTLMEDLKALRERKMVGYERKLRSFADIASNSIESEMNSKAELARKAFHEELDPVLEVLEKMYKSNDYYVRDITDVVMDAVRETQMKMGEFSDMTEEMYSALRAKLEEQLSSCVESHRKNIESAIARLEKTRRYIALKTSDLYNRYADHAYNISKPVLTTVTDRYNQYVQYMNQISSSQAKNSAKLANSAIYGARDYINFGLATLMTRNDVKYAKSISDRVYQQGYNAYKAWEIRENTQMVAEAIINWIRGEIQKEISDIKATVINTMRSKVTVYDPKNGEIQMEFHLPIPLKSLDVIPTVDLTPYITKANKFVPEMPSISLPSSDIKTWLPPYNAIATIHGNKVTTFDGVTYDLDSSCTFILARDYVDSNFSLVLHKEDNNKTFIISAMDQAVKIFADGKITVNERAVELPTVIKGISLTSLDGHVSVNVAGHVTVDYDKDMDTYIVELNGFYYGKTNGILGTYDNEPTNDMTTSYGKAADSADRFVKTWEVSSGRCR